MMNASARWSISVTRSMIERLCWMRRVPPSSSRRSRPAPRAASSATARKGLALTLRSVSQGARALLALRAAGILATMPVSILGRYLARHRARYAAGVLLLIATNACALLIPWVTKNVVDALGHASQSGTTRQTVAAGALLVVG